MTLTDIFRGGVSGGVISGARKGFSPAAPKVRVGAFVRGGEVAYQFTFLYADRATHENFSADGAAERAEHLLRDEGYAQGVFFSRDADFHATCYGRLKIKTLPPTHPDDRPAAHDRQKPRLVDADAPFVRALGLDRAARAKKLEQIEKFLELALPYLPGKSDEQNVPRETSSLREAVESNAEGNPDGFPLRSFPSEPSENVSRGTYRIVDFGCGRAYVTFALYWYLRKLDVDCEVVGVDLKQNVVDEAAALAEKLGYDGMRFHCGDAAEFDPGAVDMVVSLHACDLATDYALAWAVRRGAKSIISVPCCQHELFSQLQSDEQSPLLRGILRERTAALVTDAARAQLLEARGYKVEAVEFVDSEHTPKNLMLRARLVRSAGAAASRAAMERYRAFADAWAIAPALERLLDDGE